MVEHEKRIRFVRRSISNVVAISFVTIAFIVEAGAMGVPMQGNPKLQSKTEVDFIPLFVGG